MSYPSTRFVRPTRVAARPMVFGIVIWLSAISSSLAADTLFVTHNQQIIEYDLATAEELNRFDQPAMMTAYPLGLAFSNGRLFVGWTGPEFRLNLAELDATTGEILDLDAYESEPVVWGELEVFGGRVYVPKVRETSTTFEASIDVFDTQADQLVRSIVMEAPHPLSFLHPLALTILPGGQHGIVAFCGGPAVGTPFVTYALAQIDLSSGVVDQFFFAGQSGTLRYSLTRFGSRIGWLDGLRRNIQLLELDGQRAGMLALPVSPDHVTVGRETDGRVDIPTLSPLGLVMVAGLLALGGYGVLRHSGAERAARANDAS